MGQKKGVLVNLSYPKMNVMNVMTYWQVQHLCFVFLSLRLHVLTHLRRCIWVQRPIATIRHMVKRYTGKYLHSKIIHARTMNFWIFLISLHIIFCPLGPSNIWNQNNSLVGSWTNPIEKYAQVKLDHFLKNRGENNKHIWNHHPQKMI